MKEIWWLFDPIHLFPKKEGKTIKEKGNWTVFQNLALGNLVIK